VKLDFFGHTAYQGPFEPNRRKLSAKKEEDKEVVLADSSEGKPNAVENKIEIKIEPKAENESEIKEVKDPLDRIKEAERAKQQKK